MADYDHSVTVRLGPLVHQKKDAHMLLEEIHEMTDCILIDARPIQLLQEVCELEIPKFKTKLLIFDIRLITQAESEIFTLKL